MFEAPGAIPKWLQSTKIKFGSGMPQGPSGSQRPDEMNCGGDERNERYENIELYSESWLSLHG